MTLRAIAAERGRANVKVIKRSVPGEMDTGALMSLIRPYG